MLARRLGRMGPTVSAIGLGAMGMSDFYGAADETESTATIHAALEAGITLIDTGDFYGMGHNEMLIGEALKTIWPFWMAGLVVLLIVTFFPELSLWLPALLRS